MEPAGPGHRNFWKSRLDSFVGNNGNYHPSFKNFVFNYVCDGGARGGRRFGTTKPPSQPIVSSPRRVPGLNSGSLQRASGTLDQGAPGTSIFMSLSPLDTPQRRIRARHLPDLPGPLAQNVPCVPHHPPQPAFCHWTCESPLCPTMHRAFARAVPGLGRGGGRRR